MNPRPPFDPEKAWQLWENLNHLADQLWQAYQDAFVQRCLEESRMPNLPDIPDDPDDPDDDEDDIPF